MGCNVSLPGQPLKKEHKYKDTGNKFSMEVLKEEQARLYQSAANSPRSRQEIPDFIVKKRVKKKKETSPVTFSQEYLHEESSALKPKRGGRLKFNGDLNSLPSHFGKVGSSFQNQIQIQIKECKDKVLRQEGRTRTVKLKNSSPDVSKLRSVLDQSDELGANIRQNYRLRWTVKPQNGVLNPSLNSFISNQRSFKHNLSFSPLNSREYQSEEDLCHQLPYMSIQPKLITEVSRKCKSEPRTKKEFLDMEKSKKLRKATINIQKLRSIEQFDIPNFCNTEIKLQEVLKQKLKSKISIHELQLKGHLQTMADLVTPQRVKVKYLSQLDSESSQFQNAKEGLNSTNDTPQKVPPLFRQRTSAPIIKALVEDAAKRSNRQRRKHSQFKVEAEKEEYRQFLGYLGRGDKKRASTIMAPQQTLVFLPSTNDLGIVRSSMRRKTHYGKSPEALETSLVNKASSRRQSLPAIAETDEENRQSQRVDESIRKNSMASSFIIEKAAPYALGLKKSVFSIERLTPLLKSSSRSPLIAPRRRKPKFSVELDSPWL